MPRLRLTLDPARVFPTRFVSVAVCAVMLISQTPFGAFRATAGAAEGGAKTGALPRRVAPSAASSNAQSRRHYRDGEVLARFREDAPGLEIDSLLATQGARPAASLRGGSRVVKLAVLAGQDPAAAAASLRSSPLVEFAEPNYLINADQLGGLRDPRFDEQWALHNPGATGGKAGADIGVVGMWPVTRGNARTVIAVIDSGVDFNHPDLQANQWRDRREALNAKDDDRNGFTDDPVGWDFVADSAAATDPNGHGTAVAGIIAARGNNGVGISGVMWEAGLLSLRVLDESGTGDVAAAVEAVDYAATKGARIVNCSWGMSENSAALADAIERAGRRGVLLVASAGNHGQNIDATPYYPASYDLPNIISVAATDAHDELPAWSNWGAMRVSVAAPGDGVLTTKPGGEYEAVSGSSASAALTTGVAGLLITLNPRLTVEQFSNSLVAGVRREPALTGKVFAGGVINAGGALEALKAQVAAARENNQDDRRDNDNKGARSEDAGRAVGDGNAHRYRVPTHAPTRALPTPWLDLPSLNELRMRQPREPRTPRPIPSTRFSHRDDSRAPRAEAVAALPWIMLAVLTSQHTFPASVWLNALGNYALGVPEGDYYGEKGARYVTDAKVGLLPPAATVESGSEKSSFNAPGTGVANTKLPGRILAYQLANNSSFVSQNVPASMIAGQSYSVMVTMQNTGTVTWDASNLYRLGSQNEQDNVTWGAQRVELAAAVAPGENATFNFTVVAPSTPGNYNFQWRTVQDGVEWFGAHTNNAVVNVAASGGGGAVPARLNPLNRVGNPGDDLLSRNFNWGVPLLSLKGRSGLDLGLSLSYNSLVWTRDGQTMSFDADQGDPTPGFRLGFPVIQPKFYNAQVGVWSYLLITPAGERVEPRRVGSTNTYEAADSSYLQLSEQANGSLLARTTQGTQLTYRAGGRGIFVCTEIKDRNGNYITINYHGHGGINFITDTLGRTLHFTYDAYGKPLSITQTWRRQTLSGSSVVTQTETHEWATFGYTNLTIQTTFTNLALSGVANGQSVPMLSQVGLADGTRYNFDYGTWGQIYRITRNTQDDDSIWRPREYVHYNLPQNGATAQTDCPRFTERRDWAENWNLVGGVATEAVTTFSAWDANGASSEATTPDGTAYKEFYDTTGWRKGLTNRTEIRSGDVLKKWTTTAWEHDGGNASYQVNPRPIEMNVYDAEGNRKRTSTVYALYGLPSDIYEYAADAVTVLRRTHIDYNLSSAYTDRRIIGLVGGQQLYDDAGTLQSKVEYSYDAGDDFLQQQGAPVRHDSGGYGAGLVTGRGNRTSVRRYDVNNLASYVESSVGYNTTGSPIFSRDPLGRQTTISYQDKFVNPNSPNDPLSTVNNNTNAYPTTVTDAGGFSSTVQYNYDLGATWRAQNPKGAAERTAYDAAGRVSRVTNLVNNFYTRFAYPANNKHTERFTTLQDGGGEDYYVDFYNGRGQVRAVGGYLSYSQSGWRGQLIEHDIMGRLQRQSQMFEMSGNWVPAGDDAAGYQWTQQSYNWQGRPTVTTNADGTTTELTYGGCGCAGGQVVTSRDEVGRRQRVTSDVLGRAWKTETLLFDGTTVYSTTTNTYNVRDQLTRTFQQQGTGGTGQESLITYDGHGRVLTSKAPVQSSPASYSYFDDDTVQTMTDPRGATATYTYNSRRLVTNIAYTAPSPSPSPIPVPSPVSFDYDGAGNRTAMTDGTGSHTYVYNTLSQLTSESRQFTALPGRTYTSYYDYTVSGQLKYIIDPAGSRVDYSYDLMGRSLSVTGSGTHSVPTYASNLRYRAWGAMKDIDYGNGAHGFVGYNGRLQPTSMELRNVIAGSWNQTPLTMAWSYDYYADGRLNHAYDSNNDRFDRKLDYDSVGRLKEAYSGREARGLAPTDPADSPFRQTFGYDVWGNMTSRNARFWKQPQTPHDTAYVNHRAQDTDYDAAGHAVGTLSHINTFDAAGKQTYSRSNLVSACGGRSHEIAQRYDGDGRVSRRHQTTRTETYDNADPPQPTCTTDEEVTYYVTSGALGGATLVELDPAGDKAKGYVYGAGGGRLAKQTVNPYLVGGRVVTWYHRNAGTPSWVETASDRTFERQEMDPLGAEVGIHDPYLYTPNPTYGDIHGGAPLYVEGGDPFDISNGCIIDDMPIPCGAALRAAQGGGASVVWVSPFGSAGRRGGAGGFTYQVVQTWEDYSIPGDPNDNSDGGISGSRLVEQFVAIPTAGPLDGHIEPRPQTPIPQNPILVPRPNLREGLVDLLKNTTCANFVSELINAAATTTNPLVSASIIDVFDKISASGNVVFPPGGVVVDGKKVNGQAPGSFRKGNAGIELSERYVPLPPMPPAKPENIRFLIEQGIIREQRDLIITVLGETIHKASLDGFTDRQLARIAFDLTKIDGLPNSDDYEPNSFYWHYKVLRVKCK